MKPVFCAVADDDTGATDLAGMLADQGLRTVLIIDLPESGSITQWAADHDAVIIGVGSRALTAQEAYSRTRAAVHLLKQLNPRVIEIKYCSTFDSTAEGNIGASLDAALDELGLEFTVALPALPVNGRTTYMGHHFVHQQLLSDSPMRNHPLTPMRNSNLVSHLSTQTKRKVGLAIHPVTTGKLRQEAQIVILDCISDADLEQVCEAIADLPLISGSSAPAMKLPAIWLRKGWWSPSGKSLKAPPVRGKGYLVVAGSCSVATSRQNAWLDSQGATVVTLDPLRLVQGDYPVLQNVMPEQTVLIRTESSPQDVERVHQWAAAQGHTPSEAGLQIAYALARLVRAILESDTPPRGLLIAGGETSGAILRTLGVEALEIGRNIEPGVPVCVSLGERSLLMALKSGNFGSVDFYGRAIQAFEALA